jgi:hypothetical protein
MKVLSFTKKAWMPAISACAVAALLAAPFLLQTGVRADGRGEGGEGGYWGDEDRVRHGLAISPLPMDLRGKNPVLVGLGSYYVNAVSECVDCHTNFPQYLPGGNPFLGQPKQDNVSNYLRGGRTFPAVDLTGVEDPIKSRSLRPENGLPSGLTFVQFVDVIRNGADYDHPGRLLQVMAWPTFHNMTDHDLLAIYVYLSTLPP